MDTKSTMHGLVLHEVGNLRYEKVPLASLRPGTVRVRIGCCGVCGSDIPRCFVKGTYHFPTICGHEFAGTITAVAEDVPDWKPGERVAVFPLIWKDDHPASEEGQYAQSDGYDYLGSRSDGGFADYVIAPTRNLIRVPDQVSLEEAAMTEPAAVALHAARRANVRLGEAAAVFGLGPIGLILAQWLRAMGGEPVILFDLLEKKRDLARNLGFEHVYDSREVNPIECIEKLTGGRGAHVTFEAAGVPATMLAACGSVRRSGRVVMLGNPSKDVTLPVDLISRLMRREVSLLGTWNSGYSQFGDDDDWRTTLAAMESGALHLKPLITHQVGLSEGKWALEMMRDQSEFFCKVLLHPENA